MAISERDEMLRAADQRVKDAQARREQLAAPQRGKLIRVHIKRPVLNDKVIAENLRLQRSQQRRAQAELTADEEGHINLSNTGNPHEGGGISPELDTVDDL
jgi:hypothetical protein